MKTNLTIAAGLGNKVKAKAKTILAGGSQEDMKLKMTLAARLRNEVLVITSGLLQRPVMWAYKSPWYSPACKWKSGLCLRLCVQAN